MGPFFCFCGVTKEFNNVIHVSQMHVLSTYEDLKKPSLHAGQAKPSNQKKKGQFSSYLDRFQTKKLP